MCSIAPTFLGGRVLEQTHIVKVVLHHIDEFSSTFGTVNYNALKEEMLKPLLVDSLKPEIQIRGFLKTSHHILACKAASSNIASQDLNDKILDFIEGKLAKGIFGKTESYVITDSHTGLQ